MEIKYTRRDKSTLVHLGHLEGIIVIFPLTYNFQTKRRRGSAMDGGVGGVGSGRA